MVQEERNAAPKLRNRRRRAFTLMEVLVVVAIIGLVMAIAVSALNTFFKKEDVSGVANNVRTVIQHAVIEMQNRNLRTFVELSQVSATPPFWRVKLYADTNDNGILEPLTDAVIQTFDCPSQISFSTVNTTSMETAGWSVNTADTATRSLLCDYQGRTANSGTQVTNTTIATLEITHRDMLLLSAPKLKPSIRYEIRIGPLWNATVQRSSWNTVSSAWVKL
jgi:prepilin-type N-terminal cleavage/methylation domain-containing protein